MAPALSRIRLLLFLTACALLAGCATCPPSGAPDPSLQAIQARYPAGGFTAQQRVTLQVLGKDYPLLGVLAVSRDGRWRMQASSELGGRMFDLLGDTVTARVLAKPEPMGEKPLLQGLAGDIRALYLKGPAHGRRVTPADGGFTLENPCWHYRLQVRDLKLSPGEPGAAAFEARPAAADDDEEGD
jgi:hypothetical protein